MVGVNLIVIDGLDAAGKNTQATLLADTYKNNGGKVFLRAHPSGDCFFGKKAKHFLLFPGKSSHFASAFFYMCDIFRSIMLYVWRKYDHIILVRYLMGTAYLPSPLDKMSYYFFSLLVPTSNLMFFLDVTPTEAHKRNIARGAPIEVFESMEQLKKVRKKALSRACEDGWIIVNGEGPRRRVQKEIVQHIERVNNN